MKQLIIKYKKDFGHDVVKTDVDDWEAKYEFEDFFPEISGSLELKDLTFVRKVKLPTGEICVNLAISDQETSKEVNRITMKTHTIIISAKEYMEIGGLAAMIKPIYDGTLKKSDDLLKKKNFGLFDPVFELKPYYFAKKVLAKPDVRHSLVVSNYDMYDSIMFCAFIDRLFPESKTADYSINSFIDATHKELLEQYSLSVGYAPKSKLKMENYMVSNRSKNEEFNIIIDNLKNDTYRDKLFTLKVKDDE
ncbi:MAG: hypothetical protein INQ03_25690 [Candidatus Heimdallarchaeota archaeon]|nr:hypothetical protein [Candidatus Heimdallarchaeota archaeon]